MHINRPLNIVVLRFRRRKNAQNIFRRLRVGHFLFPKFFVVPRSMKTRQPKHARALDKTAPCVRSGN